MVDRPLVIFDVEGTLVDCVQETLSCWRETFHSFGFEFSIAELHRHSGRDAGDMIGALLPPGDAERLASALKEAQGKRYRQEYLPRVKALPQVRPLLERLRGEGHGLAIATSCASDELRHYIGLTKISDLIDTVACGEDVKREKPHPDLVRVALARAGSCAHAVMIGDTPYDAQAANAAGVTPIGVLSGGFSRSELTNAGCVAVYADPAQLLENTKAFSVALHGP